MKKILSLDFQNIFKKTKEIKKLPLFLGKHAFAAVMVLIFFNFVIGAIVIYKYIITIEKEKLIPPPELNFNYRLYEKVLEDIKTKEKIIKEHSERAYPNPFQEIKYGQ